MMTGKPDLDKYSVLMSVYSGSSPEEFRQSAESMLHQTVLCDQFILVEDGPVAEELEKLILEYESQYPGLFTVIRLKKNGGLGNALNQGIKASRNELVCRMDSDDISLPERCKKQLMRFREKPELDILGTQISEFVGEPDHIISMRIVPCSDAEIKKFARRRSPFNHPTVMYKKSSIEAIGGYPCLSRKEDLALFITAANAELTLENLDEVLLLYRTSEENQKRRRTWVNCKESIQVMYGFYKKKQIGFTDFMFVLLGQMALCILPAKMTQKLEKKYLRSA